MTDTIAAAILGGLTLTILSTFTAAWVLSGRMSRVEAKLEAMDNGMADKLTSTILTHQLKCPAAAGHRAVAEASDR